MKRLYIRVSILYLARNSDDSMTRSVVGMYSANKAHTKMAALDRDVIYAPDQVIS